MWKPLMVVTSTTFNKVCNFTSLGRLCKCPTYPFTGDLFCMVKKIHFAYIMEYLLNFSMNYKTSCIKFLFLIKVSRNYILTPLLSYSESFTMILNWFISLIKSTKVVHKKEKIRQLLEFFNFKYFSDTINNDTNKK